MGLPIWREPGEETKKQKKDTLRSDPTAAGRSSIRRRPSIHRGHFPRAGQHAPLRDRIRSSRTSPPPPARMLSPPPAMPPAPHMSNASLGAQARTQVDRLYAVPSFEAWQAQDELQTEFRPTSWMHEMEALGMGMVSPPRVTLPTPPLETSGSGISPDQTSGSVAGHLVPPPPFNGLGDRVRSPSPMTAEDQDAWQLMRSTIRSDTTLPTAESSFASAAASASFNMNSDDRSGREDSQASSREWFQDPDCLDESEVHAGNSQSFPALRRQLDQVRSHLQSREAVNRPNQSSDVIPTNESELSNIRAHVEEVRESLARISSRSSSQAPPSVPPSRYQTIHAHSPEIRARAQDATSATHAFFRPASTTSSLRRHNSSSQESMFRPPPTLHRETAQRNLAPQLSPPRQSEPARTRDQMRESASQLARLSASLESRSDDADSDLEQMRGILERLSRREDIPDEWWMSAGLSRDVVRASTATSFPPSPAVIPRAGILEARGPGRGAVAGSGRRVRIDGPARGTRIEPMSGLNERDGSLVRSEPFRSTYEAIDAAVRDGYEIRGRSAMGVEAQTTRNDEERRQRGESGGARL